MFESVHGRTGAAGMGAAAQPQQASMPKESSAAAATGPGIAPSTTITSATGEGIRANNDVSTDPKFGDVLQKIQAQYGAKPAKPREIKKTLGKDDFMRIMVMQMKHQDPTSPFKAEQMAAQMAQFASVEQLQNMNANITKMAAQNNPMERMAMTNLIGKKITVDKERFPHLEGQPEALSFALPKDAKSVKVSVVSDMGETVLQKDMGSQKAGEVSFTWDGLKGNTLPSKSGTYAYRVEAKDEHDRAININPQSTARVVGVSFEGSEPVFLIGDNQHQEKVTMKNIIRIEDDGGSFAKLPQVAQVPQMQMGAEQQLAQSQQNEAANSAVTNSTNAPIKNNFFTFQRGVGSTNLDTESVKPEAAAAIQKYMQAQNSDSAPVAKPAQNVAKNEEKGFPNGLHDGADSNLEAAGISPQMQQQVMQQLSQQISKGGEKRE